MNWSDLNNEGIDVVEGTTKRLLIPFVALPSLDHESFGVVWRRLWPDRSVPTTSPFVERSCLIHLLVALAQPDASVELRDFHVASTLRRDELGGTAIWNYAMPHTHSPRADHVSTSWVRMTSGLYCDFGCLSGDDATVAAFVLCPKVGEDGYRPGVQMYDQKEGVWSFLTNRGPLETDAGAFVASITNGL